jgi:hypothetical protein
MKIQNKFRENAKSKHGGVLGYGLLWLIGVPLPILAVIALLRGCS